MRIVIAEDSVLLRDGLTRMLTDGGFEVVAAVPDAGHLLNWEGADALVTVVESLSPEAQPDSASS